MITDRGGPHRNVEGRERGFRQAHRGGKRPTRFAERKRMRTIGTLNNRGEGRRAPAVEEKMKLSNLHSKVRGDSCPREGGAVGGEGSEKNHKGKKLRRIKKRGSTLT